jgi:hypothetical protein
MRNLFASGLSKYTYSAIIYVSPRGRLAGIDGVARRLHRVVVPVPVIPGTGVPAGSIRQKGDERSGKYAVPGIRLCVEFTGFFAELT